MDWPGWITAACTLLSIVGAMVAWWMATGSRRARTSARQAEERAETLATEAKRHREAAEKLNDEVGRMVQELQGPPLIARNAGKNSWELINNRDEAITVEHILNRHNFYAIRDLDDGHQLPRRGQRRFQAFGAGSMPLPDNLHVLVNGQEIHVPLPRS